MSSQIRKGAIISYIAIFINLAIGLLYTPWMVREIGVSDYGLYSLVVSFLSYFILDFGLGEAIARFLSLAVVKKSDIEIKRIINTTMCIYLFIDLIILIAMGIVYLYIGDIFHNFTSIELNKFKDIYIIAGFFSVCSFPFMPLNGIMISHERFVFLKLCDLSLKVSTILLIIISLCLGYGLYALVFVNGFIGFMISIIKYIYVRSKLHIDFQITQGNKSIARALFRFSIWVFIINIAHRLTLNVCPTILGIESTTVQISIFSIAIVLEGHMWNLANALNGLFVPKISSLSLKESSHTEILNLMIKIGRIQFLIMGLLLSGFFVLGKSFLSLWMGPEFTSSYIVAVFVLLPGIITYTEAIADTLLSVVNEIKWRAYLFSGSALIGCFVSFVLSHRLGALGCGIGIFISLLMCKVIGMNIVYDKVLHINIPEFFKQCHFKLLIPLLLAAIPFFIISHLFDINSWFKLSLLAILYTLSYAVIMWSIGINIYEKDIFRSIILSIKKRV